LRTAHLVGAVILLSVMATTFGSAVAEGPGPGPSPLTGYIQDPIQEIASDPDTDGRIDAIVLTVAVQANVSGNWYFYGSLTTGNGSGAGNQSVMDLPVGVTSISLEFPGWAIRRGQTDGPYAVVLSLYHFSTSYFWTRNYSTAPYAWRSFEYKAEFVNGFSAQGIDADGDGWFNYLEVSGTLDVAEAGRYRVEGALRDSTGMTWIAGARNVTQWPVGTGQFRMWFDGNAIRQRAIDGPYNVSLELMDPGQYWTLQQKTFITQSFTATQFAHTPIILAGAPTDAAVDLDANGKPDVLRVTVPVDIVIPGVYLISAIIYITPYVSFAVSNEMTVPVGPGNLVVDFSGFDITSTYVDGPYSVNLWVYENKSSFGFSTSLTTGAYLWDMWDNPYGSLVDSVTLFPRDTDGDGMYNEIEVRGEVDAKVAARFFARFILHAGGEYVEGTETVSGGPGRVPLSHTFPGWKVAAIGANGTYEFYIALFSADVDGYLGGASANRTFTWDQFEPALRLVPPPSFTPVDTDSDGMYNFLVVSFPIVVEFAAVYSFWLSAYDPGFTHSTGGTTSRPFEEGPVSVVFRLSGYDLRLFTGDATLRLTVGMAEGFGTTTVLEWSGVYAIPDPAAFENPVLTTVTFNLVAAEPLLCCSSMRLANFENAYYPYASGSASTITVALPDDDVTFIVYGTGATAPYRLYLGSGTLQTPLPSSVTVNLEPATLEEGATILFPRWSSALGWTNRTVSPGPYLRFVADLNMDPDGVATGAEILALLIANWANAPAMTIDLRLDGESVTATAGPDDSIGEGPVTAPQSAGMSRPWQLSVAASARATHRIAVNVSAPWGGLAYETMIRVPYGWTVTVADAPPEIDVTILGPRDVVLRRALWGPGPSTVNLTASVTATPSVIQGRAVDDLGAPIQGATASLSRDATEIATGTTDAEGRFTFSGLPAGTYSVTVRAAGFTEATRTGSLEADSFVDLGDIPLVRTSQLGSIRGRVLDAARGGISGARVALLDGTTELATTTTSSDGAFTLDSIPPGTYTIRVTAPGFVTRDVSVSVSMGSNDAGDIVLSRVSNEPAGLDWSFAIAAAAVTGIALAAVGWILLRRRKAKKE